MTTQILIQILREAALHFNLDIDPGELYSVENNQRGYRADEFLEFKRDLVEAARKINLIVVEQTVQRRQLEPFLLESEECIALFQISGEKIRTNLFVHDKGKIKPLLGMDMPDLETWLSQTEEKIIAFAIMPYEGIVSEFQANYQEAMSLTPMKRFFRLLGTEKKAIAYVLVYSLVIGLIGLVLPVGLQSIIEFISGGVFFSSVYVLIGLVVMGLVLIGVFQIIQIGIVEHLQRKIFTKAAFEFAFRIPRIRLEALTGSYAPELVNRFFDIITLQKGLPKILLDLSSAAIQIFFGLLLLSLYHPFFVFFSLFLVGTLAAMIYLTGPRGLESSISESKYKYKVVQWLEELARTIRSFKMAGNTDLPVRKTDQATNNYIRYRKKHFGILLTQLSFFIFFKVAIVGGLLIVGTMLVVDRQITLGQFVASEVVIILVLNAIEKIVLYFEVVYDLLTAVDKVAHITDLPIERTGGFDLPSKPSGKGYAVSIKNLYYKYPDGSQKVLNDINLEIAAGERVCIAGSGGSGKTTLTNIIAGLYTDYSGGISVNNLSMRDLDLTNLRDRIAKNISPDDIFDGTFYENITIAKSGTNYQGMMAALAAVGLRDYVSSLPEGVNTHIVSGGKGLSGSAIHRLILARCLAKNPELIILNDFFSELSKADKLDLIRCVISPDKHWTLIAVSNDPLIMASCDRVILMVDGRIMGQGPYQELVKDDTISKYFD